MLQGVWQLAKLTLATDGRRLGLHGLRFGMVVTLYLAVCYFQAWSGSSASGLKLFQSQLLITAFFLSITAVFGFSQVITEEKEEDTLGLMRLADINPLSVILGKVTSMFCDAGLLIAIQLPFTMIAITLGGISWPQVVAAYVALASYLWMLVFVGALMSVIQPTGSSAARLTTIVVGTYLLIPHLFAALSPVLGKSLVANVLGRISLSIRLMEVTESGFMDSPWCSAVAFGLFAGFVCLVISWLVFDRFTFANFASDGTFRLTTSQRRSLRSWSRPIIWREYIFCTGGIPWTLFRIAIPFGIFWFARFWVQTVWGMKEVGFAFAWASIFSGLFGLLDGSWSVSRLFRDEIRYRTWSSLVQTPCTLKQLVYDKYRGWALGLAPTIAAPFILVLGMMILHAHTRDFMSDVEVILGTASFGIAVFGYLHLLVLLSLYFGWKATPMALTICITAGFFFVASVNSGWSGEARCVLFLLTDFAIVALMCWFQKSIFKRLTQLSEIA